MGLMKSLAGVSGTGATRAMTSSAVLINGTGAETLLATGTIHNLGGSTMVTGTEVSLGHVFKRGDVPVGGSIKLKTTADAAITHQMEYETYWDGGSHADGTLRYSGFKAILPSGLTSGSSLGIRLYASADAPSRTAPSSVATVISAILATDDYQARLVFPGGPSGIVDKGSLGATGSSADNQATLDLTTTAAAPVGRLVVVVVADDNRLGSADADGAEVASVTDSAGNTYTKGDGWSNNNGTSQTGASVSLWWSVLTRHLRSGATITATFTDGATSDATAMVARQFYKDGTIAVEAVGELSNDAADPGSLNVTTTNIACLRIRAIGGEVGNNTSLTPTSSWTAWDNGNSATSGTTAEICARVEHIVSTGTGAASDPTWVACDNASVYVAFKETAISTADTGTWIAARNHALGGTLFDASTGYGSDPDRGYRVLAHSNVATTIEWWSKIYKSPTTTDYHPQKRCSGITRYYHASGRTQDRVRAGLPNMFADQGVTGRTEWENKFPSSISVYRGTTKLREWLSSDALVPTLGAGQGPWLLDQHADWDWSDATARELFWAQDQTYADTAKVFPAFDLTLTAATVTASAYMPGHPNIWPADYHQTGDAENDPRIGPVSWATLKAWKSPDDIAARRYERIGLFGLFPAWNIDEGTGLRPLKGPSSRTYGPYGAAQPTIGRNDLWTPTSPTCQATTYNSAPAAVSIEGSQSGGIWHGRYSEGVVESSHWANLWLYGAINNDECAIQSSQDHNNQLVLGRGGSLGWKHGSQAPGWNGTDPGGYSYGFGGQLRGDGAWVTSETMASLLLRKYEYDYTNLYQERVYAQHRVGDEAAYVVSLIAWQVSTSPTAFPAVFGGLALTPDYNVTDGQIGSPDSLGRQWHRFPGAAIYYQYRASLGRMMNILSDDVGAADSLSAWNGKAEKFTLAWLNASGTSCNYYWSSFESFPCYYDGDYTKTTTSISVIKDALAELMNSGTYSCPASFAENGTGSVLDQVHGLCGLADQAGAGSLYDNATLFDTLTSLRASARAMKWAVKKAA